MREYGSNINLPSLDNLFSSEQGRENLRMVRPLRVMFAVIL